MFILYVLCLYYSKEPRGKCSKALCISKHAPRAVSSRAECAGSFNGNHGVSTGSRRSSVWSTGSWTFGHGKCCSNQYEININDNRLLLLIGVAVRPTAGKCLRKSCTGAWWLTIAVRLDSFYGSTQRGKESGTFFSKLTLIVVFFFSRQAADWCCHHRTIPFNAPAIAPNNSP